MADPVQCPGEESGQDNRFRAPIARLVINYRPGGYMMHLQTVRLRTIAQQAGFAEKTNGFWCLRRQPLFGPIGRRFPVPLVENDCAVGPANLDVFLPLKKLKFFLPVYGYLILHLCRVLFVMPWSFYGRATIRALVSLMGWKNPCERIRNEARTQPLNEVVPPQQVRILYPTPSLGDVTTYELYVLNSLVSAWAPRNIFEIGTLHGRTTVNLLENAEQLDMLYTLDILENLPANKFSTHPRVSKVKRIVADSRKLDVGPYTGRMDLVFIDADHTFDAVLNDSRKSFEMLSPNGCIIWHDYMAVVDTKNACHQFMREHPERRYVQIEDTTLLVMLPAAMEKSG